LETLEDDGRHTCRRFFVWLVLRIHVPVHGIPTQ
jgi:hypothetical protein